MKNISKVLDFMEQNVFISHDLREMICIFIEEEICPKNDLSEQDVHDIVGQMSMLDVELVDFNDWLKQLIGVYRTKAVNLLGIVSLSRSVVAGDIKMAMAIYMAICGRLQACDLIQSGN